jgi:quercetin dioxygenase-like cupin family protein
MIRAVIEPHGRGEAELYSVDCEVETLHVVEGSFELIFSNERFELQAGDTVTFPGREPHTWANPSGEQAVILWTLVPAASGK